MKHLGIIWGLLLLLQDLSNYYMYVLLIASVPKYVTCGNFLEYYTKFSILSTILSCFFYSLSGLLIDYYSKKLLKLIVALNIYGMLIFTILGTPYLLIYNEFIYDYSIVILCTGWQIQQLISILLNNVYWKIIKQNVESNFIHENDTFNIYTNIGNTGDITCNISELSIFGSLIGLIYIFDIELNIILVYFFMILWLLYIMLLILIVKLVNEYTSFTDKFLEITLIEKFKYVYHNKKIYNTLMHSSILLLFTGIAQYPLSMHEINELNTMDGICDGKLNNIFILALLMSIIYLIGSLTYRLFIVDMNKIIFYKFVYPGCTLFIILLLLPIWIPTYSSLIFISICIAQALPYYLNYYNYYVITNYIDNEYYGFVLGIYGTINTILILLAQTLFLFEININFIFGLSSTLLLISSIYSIRLRHILDTKQELPISIQEIPN